MLHCFCAGISIQARKGGDHAGGYSEACRSEFFSSPFLFSIILSHFAPRNNLWYGQAGARKEGTLMAHVPHYSYPHHNHSLTHVLMLKLTFTPTLALPSALSPPSHLTCLKRAARGLDGLRSGHVAHLNSFFPFRHAEGSNHGKLSCYRGD